jgi:predicted phage terminase large subunit-like protein
MTRQMHGAVPVIIVMTRWHEDDIVGRLTDPKNPHFEEQEAKHWKIINLAFFAEDNDPLKRKPGELLWPTRFSREFGEAQRRLNPRAFASLYQGRPSVADGIYFRKSWFRYWDQNTCPPHDQLRIYAASDHAVATDEENDKTCMLIVGISADAQIYLLDCLWTRLDAQQQVEKMLDLMEKWQPQLWWAEAGQIGKAIGPFLRKRKLERGIAGVVEEVKPTKDKQARARSIQGMFADGRVWLPLRSWWRLDAEDELLKFPASANDDFVDAISWIGLKVQQMFAVHRAPAPPAERETSWGEFKRRVAEETRAAAFSEATGGW